MPHTAPTLITGAATGIGAAIARRLACPGARLFLHTGSNADALEALAVELRGTGAEIATGLGDLALPETAPALVDAARSAFDQPLSRLISNAGRAQKARFGEVTAEDLSAAFAMMPIAFFRLVEAALPDLETAVHGRVLAISSFVAHGFGTNGMLFPASGAAKAALEALAKALAVQLGPSGTTVNCIAPGFTRKDAGGHRATTSAAMEAAATITPNGRLGVPEDIAETAGFLLSPAARHITGQVIHVDGGLLLP